MLDRIALILPQMQGPWFEDPNKIIRIDFIGQMQGNQIQVLETAAKESSIDRSIYA